MNIENVCNDFTLGSLLDVIKTELSAKHLISVLFLALTIPDICCGRNTGRQKYTEWFDEWVVCGNPKPVISGSICYDIRCSILHSGSTNKGFSISCDSRNNIHLGHIVSIVTDNCTGVQDKNIRVNINELVENILSGAERFIENNGDIELFQLMDYGRIEE